MFKLANKILVNGIINGINWGAAGSILAILKSSGSIQLLAEHIYQSAAYGTAIQVVQLDYNKLRIENHNKSSGTIEISKRIKSFAVSSDLVTVWTGNQIEVIKIDGFYALII